MGTRTIEYTARIRVKVFADNDEEGLFEADHILPKLEDWSLKDLYGDGMFTAQVYVNPNNEGVVVEREDWPDDE